MALTPSKRPLHYRLKVFRIIMIVIFCAFLLKLWHVMVVRGDHYQRMADRNQLRSLPLSAARGPIYDRNGEVLAESVYTFNLFLYREEAVDLQSSQEFLASELQVDPMLLARRLEEAQNRPKFQPVLVKENLSIEEVARVLAHRSEHPEFKMFEQPQRKYRHGTLAAHVLGYVGEVSQRELTMDRFADLRPGDIVGKAGVERSYNHILTGRDGTSQVLVNSYGKILEEIYRVEPRPGEPLRLSLDLELQEKAEAALDGRPGGVLMFDPRNGEVLVLASAPSFDPNLFTSRISTERWRKLTEDPDHPLQNRVIQSAFSPGSIYKVIVALAGLETGLIDPRTSVYCSGAEVIYGHTFRCWNSSGHGRVRLHEAIQQSCNIYFYLLGQRMGIETMAQFSKQLGLGGKTGIDIEGERVGLIPTPQWKQEALNQPWYRGETISVSIGQGPINVTPAQLARSIGMIASGKAPELTVRRAETGAGQAASLGLDPAHIELVRQAMWSSVNEWGTGRAAKVEQFQVCGKTGTAQTISRDALEKLPEEERSPFEPNAWFVGFAPRDAPEVVIAVIVQRGGSGGSGAAPIAGDLLRAYREKLREPSPDGMELASR